MTRSADDRLTGLLADAEALAQAANAARQPVSELVSSSDESGAVTVTLDGAERHVTQVAVAANWLDKVSAESLGHAVMQAVMSAQLGSVRDLLASMNAAAAKSLGGSVDASVPTVPVASTDSTPLDWDGLGDMLQTVTGALDAVVAIKPHTSEVALPDDAPGQNEPTGHVIGRSDNGKVEVSFVAGQLNAVTVDPRWASRVSRQLLSETLLAAFDAAYAAEAALERAPDPLGGLAADMRSIMARLGMSSPGPEGA